MTQNQIYKTLCSDKASYDGAAHKKKVSVSPSALSCGSCRDGLNHCIETSFHNHLLGVQTKLVCKKNKHYSDLFRVLWVIFSIL